MFTVNNAVGPAFNFFGVGVVEKLLKEEDGYQLYNFKWNVIFSSM